jgi:hypothetical protein
MALWFSPFSCIQSGELWILKAHASRTTASQTTAMPYAPGQLPLRACPLGSEWTSVLRQLPFCVKFVSCLDGTATMTHRPILWVRAYMPCTRYSLSRHAILRCIMHYVVLLFTLSLVTILAARLVVCLWLWGASDNTLYWVLWVMRGFGQHTNGFLAFWNQALHLLMLFLMLNLAINSAS